jgi:protoporphyrinogen/coproporphyrinogen III oxidase
VSHVVVIGGGITGLTAAYRLRQGDDAANVTLIEASDRLGGKILGTPFAGLPNVEAGPDMFLARVPWALELCGELGIDDLVSPATGSAYVWWHGALHAIPAGLVLGTPTDLPALARTRLLSVGGKARAALEPFMARRDTDDNLGALVRSRFGDEVLERLVDPLVGGINAGDADRLSLAASAPQIGEAAARSRSLLLGLRKSRPKPGAGPAFFTPATGLGTLVEALAERLVGVDVRLGTPAVAISRDGAGYRVGDVAADAVVVAVPAFAAAPLLAQLAPSATAIAAGIPYAGVVMVTLAVPESAVGRPLDAAGHLVPKPVQRHVTAVSWASSKWAHWRVPGQHLLRASLGRFGDEHALALDDDAVVAAALADLRDQLGLRGEPTEVRVTRWPRSFPQVLPGHLERISELERALPAGVVVAGAAYRGIGIPACIRQGGEAAAAVRTHLSLR